MANLTGDFDVIAQFAVPAVNRILAAMHRGILYFQAAINVTSAIFTPPARVYLR
jgi:hypothetical protein